MQRRDEYAWVQDVLAQSDQHDAPEKAQIKAEMLAMVEQAIDAKLVTLRKGQALGIVFRVEVVNSDGALRDGPDARTSPEATDWRKAIYARDGYRCQDCGAQGALQAHHIEGWAVRPDLRYDLANGVTLCVECHAARHPERASLVRHSSYHRPPAS